MNKRIKNIPPVKNKGGYPKFIPSDEQRRTVTQLTALKVSWDEQRLAIINPVSNKPLCKKHFSKIFAEELKAGRTMLKDVVAKKYFQALNAGEAWAIKLGLRNVHGWISEGSQPLPADDNDVAMVVQNIGVRFILPPKREDVAPPIDVSPSPYEGQPADLSRPALSPPPQRVRTATGAIWEEPDSKSWMK